MSVYEEIHFLTTLNSERVAVTGKSFLVVDKHCHNSGYKANASTLKNFTSEKTEWNDKCSFGWENSSSPFLQVTFVSILLTAVIVTHNR